MRKSLLDWWPVISRYGGALGLAWSMFVDKGMHPEYLPFFGGMMMLDKVVGKRDS